MATPTDNFYRQEQAALNEPVRDTTGVRKILFKYFANWKWFVLSFMALVALGYGYTSTLSHQYKISASILIKDAKKGDNLSVLEELDLFYKAKGVENEIEILRSYTLLEEVTDDLNLQVRYAVESGWRTKEVYGSLPVRIEVIEPAGELFERPFKLYFEDEHIVFDGKTYPTNALITESFGSIRVSTVEGDSLPAAWEYGLPLIVTFIPRASLVESLHRSLQVNLIKNTSVVSLSLLSPAPQRGIDILNRLIVAYNKAAIADKNNMAGITLKFIEERLSIVEKDLRTAEQNVEQFKTEKGITDISAESSLFLQNIQSNDAELNKVKIQLAVLQQIQQYVLSNDGSSAPATLGLSDPTLISLISALTDAEIERTKLLSTTQPANLKVKAVDDEIKTLKGKLIDNIQVLRRSLETTQRNLLTESRRMESLINTIPQKERELVDITRQQEIINQLYIFLLSKREETAISHAATVADSRVIDAARSTSYPVRPNKNLILMVFGFMGLLLPVGVIWLRESLQTTISSKDELESLLYAPVVGEISLVEQANKIVVVHKSKSKQAEQMRTLRTNVEFMQAGIKVIMVTSSVSVEGKTFLSANLGAAFAVMGKKTIVLSFDLRKPGLHKVFGIDKNEGLSDYLAGMASLKQVICRTELSDKLHVITCGRIPPNPQELLSDYVLSLLFNQLKDEYDYIILDTSPVGLMSDALILNHYADVTLYLVRQNHTPKDRIKYINELYMKKRLNNIGIVVNGIADEKWNGYGYHSYKYYSGYYGNE